MPIESKSLQHTLDRVRRPRVQITYDVETGGAMEKVELPFVVGVIADLSGHPAEPPRPLKERKFVAIDRDNIDEVLKKSRPRLAFSVPNRLAGDDSKLSIELKFESMEDFQPARVAGKVEVLKRLLEARHKLDQLLGKMEGNDSLVGELSDLLGDRTKASALAEALGLAKPALPAADQAGSPAAEGAEPADAEGTESTTKPEGEA
jgi:type VI secretion system protein ImpB